MFLHHRFNSFSARTIPNSESEKKVVHDYFETIRFRRKMLRRHRILLDFMIFSDMTAHVHNDKLTSTQPFWTNRYAMAIYGSRALHFCNNIGYVF